MFDSSDVQSQLSELNDNDQIAQVSLYFIMFNTGDTVVTGLSSLRDCHCTSLTNPSAGRSRCIMEL